MEPLLNSINYDKEHNQRILLRSQLKTCILIDLSQPPVSNHRLSICDAKIGPFSICNNFIGTSFLHIC